MAMSLSEMVWTVVGLDGVGGEEYALVVLLSLYGAPDELGSCVSTAGSLTHDGSVEPSTPDDGLYVTAQQRYSLPSTEN